MPAFTFCPQCNTKCRTAGMPQWTAAASVALAVCAVVWCAGRAHGWGSGHGTQARMVLSVLPKEIVDFFPEDVRRRIPDAYCYYPDESAKLTEELVGKQALEDLKRYAPNGVHDDDNGTEALFILLTNAFREKNPRHAAVWAGCLIHAIGDHCPPEQLRLPGAATTCTFLDSQLNGRRASPAGRERPRTVSATRQAASRRPPLAPRCRAPTGCISRSSEFSAVGSAPLGVSSSGARTFKTNGCNSGAKAAWSCATSASSRCASPSRGRPATQRPAPRSWRRRSGACVSGWGRRWRKESPVVPAPDSRARILPGDSAPEEAAGSVSSLITLLCELRTYLVEAFLETLGKSDRTSRPGK